MVSLTQLFLPNLGTTLTGLVYVIVGIAVLFLGSKIPILGKIVEIVGAVLVLFGIFMIFAVSIIEDILSNANLTAGIIAVLLVASTGWLLFGRKKK